jgi:hypothetical protein
VTPVVITSETMVSESQNMKDTFSISFRMSMGDAWAYGWATRWDGTFPKSQGMSISDTRVCGTGDCTLEVVER